MWYMSKIFEYKQKIKLHEQPLLNDLKGIMICSTDTN